MSSADAVFPEAQSKDKRASTEDILGAYPPRRCGLSGLCHMLHVLIPALRV